MTDRIFGDIPGHIVGEVFNSRSELSKAGLHRPTQAGISGSQNEGADSIVLSGGYEDDEDNGEIIIYIGHGGNDQNTGSQIADQTLTRGNLALAKNKSLGLPVRVIRGSNHNSEYSPESGYRYDGLYYIEDYWHEVGRSGFTIWRYKLAKLENGLTIESQFPEDEKDSSTPGRRKMNILRIVRDTQKSRKIKKLYEFKCQVCGIRLEGSSGPYAEAAHIRPLGTPHNGPDSKGNILCLCPNHHALFDLGGFSIRDDLTLINEEGSLMIHPNHNINIDHIRYHREHYLIEKV